MQPWSHVRITIFLKLVHTVSEMWVFWHIEYLLFPQARSWCCELMIMEQSIPHSTRWASKSAGKLTCCGQLWQSWVAKPSRPVGQRDKREWVQSEGEEDDGAQNARSAWRRCCCLQEYKEKPKETQCSSDKWCCSFTIVSSPPGEHLSLVGHRQNVGRSTRHLNQLITQQSLYYLGLNTKTGTWRTMTTIKNRFVHIVKKMGGMFDCKLEETLLN